jgi:DNA-binding winged helix-turn-helix (wHTH) protein
MDSGRFRFDRFVLEPEDRRLTRDGVPVELNGRYLDALALLVRERGRLVSKDRFLAEVWQGVPVTDEALTQCVKTLRRQLRDDAARPRFIETVPKHGYRFIAAVEDAGDVPAPASGRATAVPAATPPALDAPARASGWREVLLLGGAATVGGGVAGLVGGLVYGFGAAADPLQPAVGAVSVLLVLLCLTIAAALIGAAGVGCGIAAAGFAPKRWHWSVAGGALGGLIVGAFVKLLGLDAFTLLVGHSPGDITGAGEGAILGAAVGFGAWFGSRRTSEPPLRRSVAAASIAGGAAGVVISLAGGRLMGGSLDLLARGLPGSRLRLDEIGALFGEEGFGPLSRLATGAMEGALFGGCVVGAMIVARRTLMPASVERAHP